MRSRTRLTAAATLAATATALLVAIACSPSGSAPSSASAPPGEATASGAPASPGGPPQAVGAQAAPGATSTPAPTPSAAPTSAADCTDLAVDITNDPPDGGVPMNNATTAGDAGSSDRLATILERVQKHRQRFRCCFDLWGRNHPGEEVKVTLSLELEPDGKLAKASFKRDETQLDDTGVEGCMRDVAAKIDFPPSPSGKLTTYNHRFQFKARR
jgi:hypothetical protein